MRVAVIGGGYVGLVSAAGLSQVGHHVACMDKNQAHVDDLCRGEIPIFEPGLAPMVQENQRAGRLRFTSDICEALKGAEIVLIAVGTPAGEDGSADLTQVLAVAESIGANMTEPLLVVTKSTVPVGTGDRVRKVIKSQLKAREPGLSVAIASNPEFLAEGVAVANFMRPDRIVIGVDDAASEAKLRELYAPFNRNHEKLLCMDIRSAELTKYAANAMLATRISAMNELANVAEVVGADIEKVRLGIGSDPRIGYSFIYPGAGYGGSCFPKDIRALSRTAREAGYETQILDAVESVNIRQRCKLFELLGRHTQGQLEGLTVALWGLAFKPNTDDIREAPALILLDQLLRAGVEVRAHDPQAMDAVRESFAGHSQLHLFDDPYEAVEGSDAMMLVTEWRQYWAPDFTRLSELMRQPVIFDGRNIWPPDVVRARGLTYYSIGRP